MAKNNDQFSKENLGCYLPHYLVSNPDAIAFVMVENRYVKVGSRWVLKSSRYGKVSTQWYANVIGKDTRDFFNHALGSRTTNYSNHTDYGYIVVRSTSVSPNKMQKTVREFYTPTMWKNSGTYIIQKYDSKRGL